MRMISIASTVVAHALMILAVIALAVMASPVTIARANDQSAVIGLGMGVHNFFGTDDVRQGSAGVEPINEAGLVELFGEWIWLDDVGIGARALAIGAIRDREISGREFEERVEISLLFATAHWVVFGSEEYVRVALVAGLGAGEYESSFTRVSSSNTHGNSTVGTAALAGGYLDWGGSAFGARAGFHAIHTRFDDLKGNAVDGSGTSYYFNLRWAFE